MKRMATLILMTLMVTFTTPSYATGAESGSATPSHTSPDAGHETPAHTESPAQNEHADHHEAASAHHEEKFDVSAVITHHLADAPLWKLEVGGIDMSITKRVMMMFIGAFILLVVFLVAARLIVRNTMGKPGRFQGTVEVFVNYIRNDISHDSIGHDSHIYDPLLLTIFFFVLAGNLLGLIPPIGEFLQVSGEALGILKHSDPHVDSLALPLLVKLWPGITYTGDIGVTATLAIVSFFAIVGAGFFAQGIAFIRNVVPEGIHWALWPILWPIEISGFITKPFALAIRLLANMTAGHMIILVLMSFIFQFQSYLIAPVSVAMSTAITLLELFTAFLQAYIFTFLTALFIGQVQHRH